VRAAGAECRRSRAGRGRQRDVREQVRGVRLIPRRVPKESKSAACAASDRTANPRPLVSQRPRGWRPDHPVACSGGPLHPFDLLSDKYTPCALRARCGSRCLGALDFSRRLSGSRYDAPMIAQVAAFISERWCVPPELVRVELEPLQGGLTSSVARARVARPDGYDAIPRQLVIKQLAAGLEREADVYEVLWRHLNRPPAVRMIGREPCDRSTLLYLEHVQPSVTWPWSDIRHAGAVCRALARLHDDAALPREPFAWDYESELARSTAATVALAEVARDPSGRRFWRRLGDLRRVAAALPRIRRHLLSAGTTVLHGDIHPGNVMLRTRGDSEVALIDWGRARLGSPLEDIASWLHSLGCWEPEARRRHDTLMRTYLDARRMVQSFAGPVRMHYWLASASNGLSGAIRYHLAVLSHRGSSEPARYDSGRACIAWEQVVRRTAALLSLNRPH
jgi:hypothetical protein